MRRTLTVAVIVVALLQHAFLMAANGLVYYSGEGIGHAMLHWQEAGHHHHDNGSVHEDPSDDESARHLQADGALVAAALPCALPVFEPLPVREHYSVFINNPLGPPFLEGPTRPPRLTA